MTDAKNDNKGIGSKMKRFRVYQEDAKTRRTTHWDWDYMSRKELDALAEQIRGRKAAEPSRSGLSTFRKRLTVAMIIGGILLLLVSGFVLIQSLLSQI